MTKADLITEYRTQHADTQAQAKAGRRLLNKLIAAGQRETIRVEFSGSGDEGGIDSVEGLDEKHALIDKVRDWAEEFAATLPDWWNNDGGSGYIEFDVEAKEIRYSVSQCETVENVAESGTL